MELITKLNEKIDNNKICPRYKGKGMVLKALIWEPTLGSYYYTSGHCYKKLSNSSISMENSGRATAFSLILDKCL